MYLNLPSTTRFCLPLFSDFSVCTSVLSNNMTWHFLEVHVAVVFLAMSALKFSLFAVSVQIALFFILLFGLVFDIVLCYRGNESHLPLNIPDVYLETN